MITTMRQLRELIAENCDFSQPLRVVAHDVGKKAAKHSAVRVDEDHPVKLTITPGMYDDRGSIEFAYDSEFTVLMPEDILAALDDFLEDNPRALIGWVYFFYFPMDMVTMFRKIRHINLCLLDTNDVRDIYFAEGETNTLVVEAAYGLGSFDM